MTRSFFRDIFMKVSAFIKRRWAIAKRYEYRKVWSVAAGLLEVLPGLMAWAIEVLALAGSIVCVVDTVRLAHELRFWPAVFTVAVAGLLLGLAMLTDRYTRPRESSQGGGAVEGLRATG